MQPLVRMFSQAIAASLIAALFTPTIASANPKPLDPGTVHVKILKRGVGNFIAVQEQDGVQLFGRILDIGDHSFTLQLHNDPQTTEIPYTDVAYLRTGFTSGQKAILIGGIAAVAGLSIWGFVQLHNLAHQPFPPPTPALKILQ